VSGRKGEGLVWPWRGGRRTSFATGGVSRSSFRRNRRFGVEGGQGELRHGASLGHIPEVSGKLLQVESGRSKVVILRFSFALVVKGGGGGGVCLCI